MSSGFSFQARRGISGGEMTLTEARKILGLGPDEDPRPQLAQFNVARERIAEMVRSAPNEMLAERYQEGLVEFDRALAAVREYLEALGLVPKEADAEKRGHAVFVPENRVTGNMGLPAIAEPVPDLAVREEEEESGASRSFAAVCWVLLLLAIIGFGGWTYLRIEDERNMANQQRVAFLERQGAMFIEGRRWPEAAEAFDEIKAIFPDSDLVTQGRRSIEAGMAEEQNQFIGYWKGEAISAFEASRWSDSEVAARKVLEKYPDEEELVALIDRIDVARQEEERQAAFAKAREQIELRKFDEALAGVEALLSKDRDDSEALLLLSEARSAKEKAERDLVRALELLAMAEEADKGVYNEEAINWMREAVVLAPEHPEILAEYEKLASYTRTIRVPQDVETIAEALATARDEDRILLSEGTWEGPLVMSVTVELEGVPGKTIVSCGAEAGSVLTTLPDVRGGRVSGLVLRHTSFDPEKERFSLALVRGGAVEFSDCRFEAASGHGLAVTEGGHAKVIRCRFSESGWNGIAVMGSGSLLEAEGNLMKENFQNGVESWDGAAVILSKNTCTGNSRNGIHVDNGAASVTLLDNTLSGNREYGLVLSSSGSGQITGNTVEKNLLGGMVGKAEAVGTKVTDNDIRGNLGPGLVLEAGVINEAYLGNRITRNEGKELVTGLDFTEE